MSRRVAAIDCGTNSLRLLIADIADGRLTDVTRQLRIVRLGQGVDGTGHLRSDALMRAETALREYAGIIATADVAAVRMVATSAVRDAGNRAEFETMVLHTLGQRPEIASGLEEANLSFAGACSALPVDVGPVLVADIGGGSTEVVGGAAGVVNHADSLDLGSVRLTERHVRSDPMSVDERNAVAADVDASLSAALAGGRASATGAQFVGVAGTVTTVAAMALRLRSYDSARIEGARLTRPQIEAAVGEIVGMPRSRRLATGVIHPGRVDVIAAGAVILQTLMARLGAPDIVVTEHDILDGIALSLLA